MMFTAILSVLAGVVAVPLLAKEGEKEAISQLFLKEQCDISFTKYETHMHKHIFHARQPFHF